MNLRKKNVQNRLSKADESSMHPWKNRRFISLWSWIHQSIGPVIKVMWEIKSQTRQGRKLVAGGGQTGQRLWGLKGRSWMEGWKKTNWLRICGWFFIWGTIYKSHESRVMKLWMMKFVTNDGKACDSNQRMITPPKTNMTMEKTTIWRCIYLLFQMVIFQPAMFSFRLGVVGWSLNPRAPQRTSTFWMVEHVNYFWWKNMNKRDLRWKFLNGLFVEALFPLLETNDRWSDRWGGAFSRYHAGAPQNSGPVRSHSFPSHIKVIRYTSCCRLDMKCTKCTKCMKCICILWNVYDLIAQT